MGVGCFHWPVVHPLPLFELPSFAVLPDQRRERAPIDNLMVGSSVPKIAPFLPGNFFLTSMLVADR
jgi:hypothetical protein